jgi:protein O-GlcNAc transferase
MNYQTETSTIQNGINFYQAGQYDKALSVFDRILKRDSRNADAHHLGGLALLQLKQFQKASEYIQKAVRINPRTANFRNSLGSVYQSMSEWDHAAKTLEKSIQLDPASIQSYLNLGNVFKQSGNLTKAIQVFKDALKIDPSFQDTRYKLANALKEAGNYSEAIEYFLSLLISFTELTSLVEEGKLVSSASMELPTEPRSLHVQALNNLCVLLIEQNRNSEAIALLQQGIRFFPEHTSFHINLGIASSNQNNWKMSLDCFLNAVDLEPINANAHFNVGHAYQNLGQYTEAIACYQKAIQYKSAHFESHNNSGMIFLEAADFNSAKISLDKAFEISPDNDAVRANLSCLAIKTGHLEQAREHYQYIADKYPENDLLKLRAISLCPDLIHSNSEIDLFRAYLSQQVNDIDLNNIHSSLETLAELTAPPPYNLQFHGRNDRYIKEQYADIYRTIIRRQYSREDFKQKQVSGKPKLGFLITSGHEGAFERFIGGIVKRLNYESFEPIIFCGSAILNSFQEKVNCDSLKYVPLPNRLDQAIQVIKEQNLNLLYHWEVGSDSVNYLVPFFKPAQKQIVSMGMPVTTGIKEIDYFLTSRIVEPETHDSHYTENVILGETLMSWQDRREWKNQDNILDELGISGQNHLYLCGHKIQKFNPDFDPVLAQILDRDSNGLILIPGDKTGLFTPQLLERFEKEFPGVCSRFLILPKLNYDQYFSLVSKCDVLLDPLHYGGGLSSYDGFSMNKVIVTLPGEFHRGRYTAAFYHKMELPSFISSTVDKYVNQAVQVGTDKEYRVELESKIKSASPVLFQNQDVVNEYQQVFEKLIHG